MVDLGGSPIGSHLQLQFTAGSSSTGTSSGLGSGADAVEALKTVGTPQADAPAAASASPSPSGQAPGDGAVGVTVGDGNAAATASALETGTVERARSAVGVPTCASRVPATPSTPLERVSFLMRMAFFLRTERDVSIFPFMGVAFIVAKLCCLAATTDDSDKKLLEATVRNLFSTPAKALAFMEEAFGVGAGGLALGGRLKHYKHVRGQPISFDAEAFRTLINPEEQRAQWFSRLLCLREELVLLPGVTEVRGGLGRHEMTALATRLLADSLVRQAHRVGCIVHYLRDANNNVATAKIHFTWDFRLSEDVKLISLIRELRPLLLRQPPQSLTRQPPPPVSSLPGGEACGIGQNTPGVHGDGVDVALAWDGRPHGGDRGDGNGGGEVFAGDPEDARTGAANDMVVVKAAGGSTPSSAGRHSVASTIGTKRQFTDGALGRPHQARSLSKGNDKRGAAVKQARTKAPAPPSCACSADRLVKAGPSWIVAEVRVRGSSNLAGMAVGLQLP